MPQFGHSSTYLEENNDGIFKLVSKLEISVHVWNLSLEIEKKKKQQKNKNLQKSKFSFGHEG